MFISPLKHDSGVHLERNVWEPNLIKFPSSCLLHIKKLKLDNEPYVFTYTGISQSAIREIALNTESNHENVVALREVILEDKPTCLVFEYVEHDFPASPLRINGSKSNPLLLPNHPIPVPTVVLTSVIYQLFNGFIHLHASHILHCDLKSTNISITSQGGSK
ncbi:kinase-like domain-containing protein [Coprinopsis sp. MPI-PUGE-AT-0042]|nr:kinase-like domain-containing protein [Coprinopsis sp. MPI-PUGE-AT-0042]